MSGLLCIYIPTVCDVRVAVQTVFGSEAEPSRWRECVSYVNDHMGNALGRMFVKEHFDETSKSTVCQPQGHNV